MFTKQEIKKLNKKIAKSMEDADKWYDSLSDEERKKVAEEVENSRLWEDWSDIEVKPLSDKKSGDH